MAGQIDPLFIEYSCSKLRQYLARVEDCLGRLDDAQIWWRGSENANSAGNLVLHLCGNITQWIGFGLGEHPDRRDRDAEFAARDGVSGAELRERFRAVIEDAVRVIRSVRPEQLTEMATVQNYHVTKLEVIYHVVEHCSGHVGQIIFLTKLASGEDLGHYQHLSGKSPGPNPTRVP
jgi:uncharacterized damage-inducible protein DinB